MFRKGIPPLTLMALAGCVGLLPSGLQDAITGQKGEASAKPGETSSTTAGISQTHAPEQHTSPSPFASASPSPSPSTNDIGMSATPTPIPSPTATQNSGATPTPSPSQSASVTPTAAPTPKIIVIATPTPTPYAISVAIAPPASHIIFLHGSGSGQQINPTKLQLKAVVTMSNQATNSSLLWLTTSSDVAVVDQNGLVMAGNMSGSVLILAVSADIQASASILVEVKSGGLADIIVK